MLGETDELLVLGQGPRLVLEVGDALAFERRKTVALLMRREFGGQLRRVLLGARATQLDDGDGTGDGTEHFLETAFDVPRPPVVPLPDDVAMAPAQRSRIVQLDAQLAGRAVAVGLSSHPRLVDLQRQRLAGRDNA